jgi:hypothetical protein
MIPESSTEKLSAKYFLHDTQTSLLITGYSRRLWTGILLSDNFFQPVGNYPEDSLEYYEDAAEEEESGGPHIPVELDAEQTGWDPFTLAKTEIGVPENRATEYFFQVIGYRMAQGKEEAEDVVSILEEGIQNHVSERELLGLTIR